MTTKKRPPGKPVVKAKRGGPPHLLNARILQNFVNALASGNYITAACEWVGVKQVTYYHWLNRGEKELERVNLSGVDAEQIVSEAIAVDLPDDPEEAKKVMNSTKGIADLFNWCPDPFLPDEWKFVLFRVMTSRARGEAEIRALTLIQRAANEGSWQAAAWYLERSHPDKWGKRERLQLEGAGGGPVQHEVKVVTLEELEARLSEVAEVEDMGELEE